MDNAGSISDHYYNYPSALVKKREHIMFSHSNKATPPSMFYARWFIPVREQQYGNIQCP